MTTEQYEQLFLRHSSDALSSFNAKIVNSVTPVIGCTVPFVRAVAKDNKGDLQNILSLPDNRYLELDMLKGIALSSAKLPFAEKTRLLSRHFLPYIDNWAVCDVSTVKFPPQEEAQYFAFFVHLAKDKTIFPVRYGIVNLMSFLTEKRLSDVFAALDKVAYGEYYVDMAAAWLLATAAAKFPQETGAYMEKCALPDFVFNKALQKMRESRRVLPEMKQWTYTVKR